jgi:hypothetical protein
MNQHGSVKNREVIMFKQPPLKCRHPPRPHETNQPDFMIDMVERKQWYRSFLTTLNWRREDPSNRMFEAGFKGADEEYARDTDDGSYVLSSFDELGTTGMCSLGSDVRQRTDLLDDASNSAVFTPSGTRTNFVALTKQFTIAENERQDETKSLKRATLKYIAVIETNTDKALFDLEPADITAETHKLLVDSQI